MAARFAELFYLGETIGRIANGFVADRFGDKMLIRVGIWIMLLGSSTILLPVSTNVIALAGLIVVGLGAALGMYPLCPGDINWVSFKPAVKSASILGERLF